MLVLSYQYKWMDQSTARTIDCLMLALFEARQGVIFPHFHDVNCKHLTVKWSNLIIVVLLGVNGGSQYACRP